MLNKLKGLVEGKKYNMELTGCSISTKLENVEVLVDEKGISFIHQDGESGLTITGGSEFKNVREASPDYIVVTYDNPYLRSVHISLKEKN